MKTMFKLITITLGAVLICSSCNQPECKNTNPIFDKYSPESNEYKKELANVIANIDRSKLTFWIDSYLDDNVSQRILANVQGEGLCAKMVLIVYNPESGLENIIANKAVGYHGAELEDVQFEIKQDSTSIEFLVKEIGGVVD